MAAATRWRTSGPRALAAIAAGTAGRPDLALGGLSSHGAIVNREFGLPCVINTGNGTRVIRTGDRLHVDGDSGIVTITEHAERR